MNKKWVLIPMALVLLTVGIVTTGATLASSDSADGSSRMSNFASRVAGILGLDEAQVEDALQQARSEMKEEVLQSKLDAQVASGQITQEQANEYMEWYHGVGRK